MLLRGFSRPLVARDWRQIIDGLNPLPPLLASNLLFRSFSSSPCVSHLRPSYRSPKKIFFVAPSFRSTRLTRVPPPTATFPWPALSGSHHFCCLITQDCPLGTIPREIALFESHVLRKVKGERGKWRCRHIMCAWREGQNSTNLRLHFHWLVPISAGYSTRLDFTFSQYLDNRRGESLSESESQQGSFSRIVYGNS